MEKVKLGQLTNIKTGRLDVNAENPNGKYPFFTCSKNHTYIDEYAFDGESVLVAGNGDLNVKYYNGKFNAYQRTYVIQANENLNGKFLYYFLDSYVEKLREQSIGGVIKYIKLGNLTDAEIPLPKLATQQRIAAILDQADAIIQNNRAIVQKYDALTQSLFLDMFGDPVKNEKGWETDKVVNVCSKIFGGGTPSKAKPEYFIGNIPWVTPKDMKSEYIFDSIDHVNLKAIENSSAKLIPSGNLLMVIRSGILKHTLPLAINKVDVTVNQDMKAFIPNAGKTNTIFLKYFFQCSSSYLLGKVRAVTADNIEFNQIKELSFPLVPINLQNQFAERVQAIDVQKQQAQLELAKSEELFQSLLQRAFNGELS